MKKLAIIAILTISACSHYSDGYDNAYHDVAWNNCKFYITDPTPLKDEELVAALKKNNCIYITDHYDYSTNPLEVDIEYYKGYNAYVKEHVLGK